MRKKTDPKTSPSYLLKVARKYGEQTAFVLSASNADKIARGEVLTPAQLSDLTDITIQNLQKQNILPQQFGSAERMAAFIKPFQDQIIKAGLF
jgi:hypothetical protein